MEQTQVILDLFLPADQQRAKTIHPTMSPLDDPTSGLVPDSLFEGLHFFTPCPNMQGVAKCSPQFPNFIIVIAFIQAQVLRMFFCWMGTRNRNTVQCRV